MSDQQTWRCLEQLHETKHRLGAAELRIKELEGEISFVKECNRMVKAANDEAHRENEKLAAQVSQYAGKMLANQYDYTSVRRAGSEAMRERAAKVARTKELKYFPGKSAIDVRMSHRESPKWNDGEEIAVAIEALEIEG